MNPWKKIPFGNHHFQVPAVSFRECKFQVSVFSGGQLDRRIYVYNMNVYDYLKVYIYIYSYIHMYQ